MNAGTRLMLEVISTTSIAFIVIALGYVSVKRSLFSPLNMEILGKYVINFALPALIFQAISGRDFREILNIGYLGAYLGGSLLIFAGGYAWSRRVSGLTPMASIFQSMGMSCSNSGYVGYPILLVAMPAIASTALALNMIVENLIMIPLALVMAEHARGGAGARWTLTGQIALRLIRNPIIIALITGLAVSLLGLEVPEIIAGPIDLVAASSAAVSLVAIGGMLAAIPLRALDVQVMPVVVGKLLLHPLAVWIGLLMVAAAGIAVADQRLAQAAILMAAMPAMSIYPILAQSYGQQRTAALALLMMTALSFFSISAALALLQALPPG
jgi:predicted permease